LIDAEREAVVAAAAYFEGRSGVIISAELDGFFMLPSSRD
jgi:hypothetical protein